ncbi:hypothetical protein Scep_009381 [Stephania cephalantha]|uniref:Uncharacterized protein n=1 Tax=Stephania cephalantha TaxID=152367 RepID=A0AAP0JU26_9MAGN
MAFLLHFWAPIKLEDQVLLSTCDQSYLLDHILVWYRKCCNCSPLVQRKCPAHFLSFRGVCLPLDYRSGLPMQCIKG